MISNESEFSVLKRDGTYEPVYFDKITKRIGGLVEKFKLSGVDVIPIVQSVVGGLCNKIKTEQLDHLASGICANKSTVHPHYEKLASALEISNHHKETAQHFSDAMAELYHSDQITKEFATFVRLNASSLDSMIHNERDYDISYFGFKTLEKAYLKRINGVLVERVGYMFMRVACALHSYNHTYASDEELRIILDRIKETYDAMSLGRLTHATPTLFHSGSKNGGLVSCYLLGMSDSVKGIFKCVSDCALISKHAGGIGLSATNIRGNGSKIKGTDGISSGLIPFLRVFDTLSTAVNQSGKRPASIAVYLEPHHCDIEDFLDLKKTHGKEEFRARALFYAIWISDLFMRRVTEGKMWTLFSPDTAPGLDDVYGEEYERLYEKYERQGLGRKVVKAEDIWNKMLDLQVLQGVPYISNKDRVNRLSNQKNLGVIKNSNLCNEITLYSRPDEYATCCIGSIAVGNHVKYTEDGHPYFDYKQLWDSAQILTRNLNQVIDSTFYPVDEAKKSSLTHRPIGVGISGLADAFLKMRLAFDSDEAQKISTLISSTIYGACLNRSSEMAEESGAYETFWKGYDGKPCPAAEGKLHFDLWAEADSKSNYVHPYDEISKGPIPSDFLSKYASNWSPPTWNDLKARVMKYGLRNSLLCAYMPTASTSQILNMTECFEPISGLLYVRRVLSGEFQVVNKYLIEELSKIGMWDERMKNRILNNKDSIQSFEDIPQDIRRLFKTSWETSRKRVIDMAAERQPYIDQTQSMNIYMESPTRAKLNGLFLYGWKQGLKTMLYYLKSQGGGRMNTSLYENAKAEKIVASEVRQMNVSEMNMSEMNMSEMNKNEMNENVDDTESESFPVCNMEPGCGGCSA